MWRFWLALALAGCAGEGGDQPHGEGQDQAEPVTVVEMATATSGTVIDEIVSSAVVEALAQADLVPEATGVVVQVHKDEGDPVTKGEVLAVLDNAVLGTGAERARGEVARLEQQVSQARELLQRGAISNRELEDLEHQLNTAKLSAREASRTWGQTRIVAPFDGVVAMRGVQMGELATGATVAFQIVDPSQLRVVAALPERDLSRISVGQPARLVSAYDPDHVAQGHVARMAPVVDANSGTFRVTVAVDQAAGLRPGQFVSVRLQVDEHEGVLVVPKQAVVWEDGTPVVYKVGPPPEKKEEEKKEEAHGGFRFQLPAWLAGGGEEGEGGDEKKSEDQGPPLVAVRTRVELVLVDEQWAEVGSGLAVGDRVVVVGQSNLRDGARVREAAAKGEAAKAGSGDQG
jgi:membrane fusion protein (multidrug efflux system)